MQLVQGTLRHVRQWLVLLFVFVSFVASSLVATAVHAQEDPPEAAVSSEDDDMYKAPVVVDGDELFFLRGTSALPADERVANVAAKIVAAAEANDTDQVLVESRDHSLGQQILVDGQPVTVVTQADADLEEMDTEVLTKLQVDAIREAILRYRAERTEEARIGSALAVGVWTLVFALFTFLMLYAKKRLGRKITKLALQHFAQVESATNAHVQAEAVASLVRFGINLLLLVIYFLGLYYFLSLVLLSFAETRPIAQILLKYVTEPVLNVVKGFIGYLPNLITLTIIVLITRYVIRGLGAYFDALEAGSFKLRNFEKHWIWPTYNILRVATMLVALVFAFPYIPGSDSQAFQGLAIILGAMLSIGSNSVVANALAGLFVIYRRSTSIGDRIQIGEHTGDVVEIKLMETHLKSIKNELISIPNAQMMNSEVINFSKKIDGSGLLVHTTVGIGYEEPPDKIEAMLIEAVHRTKGLKTRPDPFVLYSGLADFAVNYQVNAFCTRGSHLPRIRSDLHRHILDVFNENHVQIMTPSYEADTPDPKIAPDLWQGKLAHEDAEASEDGKKSDAAG